MRLPHPGGKVRVQPNRNAAIGEVAAIADVEIALHRQPLAQRRVMPRRFDMVIGDPVHRHLPDRRADATGNRWTAGFDLGQTRGATGIAASTRGSIGGLAAARRSRRATPRYRAFSLDAAVRTIGPGTEDRVSRRTGNPDTTSGCDDWLYDFCLLGNYDGDRWVLQQTRSERNHGASSWGNSDSNHFTSFC